MKDERKKRTKKPVGLGVFKYSTRNKSDRAFIERAWTLKKKFGIDFSFSLAKKLTPQAKSSITRKVRRLGPYLNNQNRFEFVQVKSRGLLRKAKRNQEAESAAVTDRGIFVQVPKSGKGSRITIRNTGEIEVATGRRRSTRKIYRSTDIVSDPEKVLREAKRRKAEHVLVNIKGFSGKTTYTVGQFYHYLTTDLLPDISDAIEAKENGEKSESAFGKYFGVEFVTFDKPSKKTRSTKTKNRKTRK